MGPFAILTGVLILLKTSAHKGSGLTWMEWLLVSAWALLGYHTVAQFKDLADRFIGGTG
jgi:hypothetical protein